MKAWIGLYFVDPHYILDHFTQFAYSSGGFKPRRFFLQFIWLFSVWEVWNERNYKLFFNKAKSILS